MNMGYIMTPYNGDTMLACTGNGLSTRAPVTPPQIHGVQQYGQRVTLDALPTLEEVPKKKVVRLALADDIQVVDLCRNREECVLVKLLQKFGLGRKRTSEPAALQRRQSRQSATNPDPNVTLLSWRQAFEKAAARKEAAARKASTKA
jgi:hypothetical protein